MSLVPFVTAYMGNNCRDPRAVALYGVVLALCSVSFVLLRSAIIHQHRDTPTGALSSANSVQESHSLLFYVAAVRWRLWMCGIAFFIFVFVALSYFCRSASWRSRSRAAVANSAEVGHFKPATPGNSEPRRTRSARRFLLSCYSLVNLRVLCGKRIGKMSHRQTIPASSRLAGKL